MKRIRHCTIVRFPCSKRSRYNLVVIVNFFWHVTIFHPFLKERKNVVSFLILGAISYSITYFYTKQIWRKRKHIFSKPAWYIETGHKKQCFLEPLLPLLQFHFPEWSRSSISDVTMREKKKQKACVCSFELVKWRGWGGARERSQKRTLFFQRERQQNEGYKFFLLILNLNSFFS